MLTKSATVCHTILAAINNEVYLCADGDIDLTVGELLIVRDLYKAFPEIVRMYDCLPSVQQVLKEIANAQETTNPDLRVDFYSQQRGTVC